MSGSPYIVEYEDDANGLTLQSIEPFSLYVENLFYSGVLLRDVSLGDEGLFQLIVWISEDGDISILKKYKNMGWVHVDT